MKLHIFKLIKLMMTQDMKSRKKISIESKGSFKVNLNHRTRNVSDVEKQITLPSHQNVQQNLLNVIGVIRRDILQVCVELESVMQETIKRK